MKTRKLLLLLGFLILAFLLSGCASGMTPSSWPGLASDGENVYVAYANQVYAVQVSNGVEIWRFPEKVSAKMLFYAQPALTPDGQLIVSGYDSILYSLNPNDGSENWTFTGAGDRWIGSAAVDGDTIYAPNADYSLYALDLQGNLKWSFETGAAIWSRPVVGDNFVYVASMDSTIYALDITTGKKVWSQMLDGAVLGPLTIGNDGSVFATTLGETVYALNPSSGKILWSSPSSAFIWSGAEPGDGSLFVGNSAGKFFSLDMKSGKENWLIQPDGSILGTSLVLPEQVVFGTESGSLVSVDYTGKITWTKSLTGMIYSDPILAGDLIIVAPMDGDHMLIAMDQAGNQQWVYTPAK
ncbi:MAG: PQQ-binding-like beta-propeller repeat protein [Anaerolineales bacterium]